LLTSAKWYPSVLVREGGIYPEQLPPAEDVKKVERRLAKGEKDAKTDHNIR
jgi:hypothetical protein